MVVDFQGFVWELSELSIDSEEGAVGLRLCKFSRPDLFFRYITVDYRPYITTITVY